jgi:hypothetical protein
MFYKAALLGATERGITAPIESLTTQCMLDLIATLRAQFVEQKLTLSSIFKRAQIYIQKYDFCHSFCAT